MFTTYMLSHQLSVTTIGDSHNLYYTNDASTRPAVALPPQKKQVAWADEVRNRGKRVVRFACHDEIIPRECQNTKHVSFACADELMLPRLLKDVEVKTASKKTKKVRFATDDEIIETTCSLPVLRSEKFVSAKDFEKDQRENEGDVKKVRFVSRREIIGEPAYKLPPLKSEKFVSRRSRK